MTHYSGQSSPKSPLDGEGKTCDKCHGLCHDCQQRVLKLIQDLVRVQINEIISRGVTGNYWITIPQWDSQDEKQ